MRPGAWLFSISFLVYANKRHLHNCAIACIEEVQTFFSPITISGLKQNIFHALLCNIA